MLEGVKTFFGKLGPVPKLLIVLIIMAGVYFGINAAGLLGHKDLPSFIPSVDFANKGKVEMAASDIPELPLPSDTPTYSGTELRKEGYEWMSQTAEMYASGGPVTTQGSLMEKYGVKLIWSRQDDTGKSKEMLLKFATAYAAVKDSDPKANPSEGIHLFTIMGSGTADVVASLKPHFEKLGLHVEVLPYSTGSSQGEDKFIGPVEWKSNPQLARGAVVICVPRDGDQDIVFLWADQNQIPINTDSAYYDPDAINFLEVNDYRIAAEMLVQGKSIERPWRINGKVTSKKDAVKANATATWFPMDKYVFERMGGMTTLASTKEYPWQMPNITIGVREWNENHREVIEGFMAAAAEAADQIKKYPNALRYACQVSTKVYKNPKMDAEEYVRAFKSYPLRDPFGNTVYIGGSEVKNLADNLYMLGLSEKNRTTNYFENTYTAFGKMHSKAYPNDLPSFPPLSEVLNLSYLKNVAQRMPSRATYASATVPTYTSTSLQTETLAKGDYTIEFRSGSAEFGSSAMPILRNIKSQILITNSYIEVHGYTDDVGSAEMNDKLSLDRAIAVKNWLDQNTGGSIGGTRVRVFGHGISNTYDNATESGRAKNRRIEIRFVKVVG